MSVSVMSGAVASLPCSLSSSVPDDKVRLVLWFKENEEKPIYSLDARGLYLNMMIWSKIQIPLILISQQNY